MPRIHKTSRSIFASVLLWLLASGSAPAMAVGTFYVSPTGSDASTGGINDPFLTITHARDALRAAGGGTVYLRGGTYTLTSTVVFDQRDSNSTYQGYSGEVPIISGGLVLNNWTLYSGDIYRTSVNWNFRGLFKDGVRLNYRNPITQGYRTRYTADVTFTDSANPSTTGLVNPGDWELDYAGGYVYYKTGGGAPTGTIVAGSVGKLFQITGTETSKVTNVTFDHLYFYYNNWLIPGVDDTTFTDNWVGGFAVSQVNCGVTGGCAGQIPGAVEVEFASNAIFRSCRIAHNESTGIAFGRGVINSQVVGSEVWDNGGIGIFFGYMGNTGTGGWIQQPWRDPNGHTLTYTWYDNANWIENSNAATDNYVHGNGVHYPTTGNVRVGALSNAQVNYNRTDNNQFASIVGGEFYSPTFQADNNHISRTNMNPSLRDSGGIYSASGQALPNVGYPAEYIGNLVHDAYGYGPLYTDTGNDQYTINNNVSYDIVGTGIVFNNGNNIVQSINNNTSPTQAQIDAAAANTGPRSPYREDLDLVNTSEPPDTGVTFSDRPGAPTPLTGVYGGVDWGSQSWYTTTGQQANYAIINSVSTSQVTQTFTLPAGTVLKGFAVWGNGTTTVTVSSAGNPNVTYNPPNGAWTIYRTGWCAISGTVTVAVTSSGQAQNVGISNIVYGKPSDSIVTFSDRPDSPLSGIYAGIDWGSQLWYSSIWQGQGYLWIYSGATTLVTQTFTLPTEKVLKGLSTVAPGGSCNGSTVTVSSPGNATQTYTLTANWTDYKTGWTVASATVTVGVTCSTYAAWGVYFRNLIYGIP